MKRRMFLFIITLLIALSNMNCAAPPFSIKQAEFDGLIIDATEQNFKLAMAPKIVSSRGYSIYDPSVLSRINDKFREFAIEQGSAAYARSIDEAKGRRGIKNPLIVKAVGMLSKEELIVSDEDAKKILSADKNTGFLANANVIIVVKPKSADVAKPKIEPRKIRVKGSSPPPSKDAPIEIRAQEQFVVAVLIGIRNIAELVKETEIDHKEGKIFSSIHGKIGDFELDSQTIVDTEKFNSEDLINVIYMGQKFVIKNFQLISPPIESVKFPKWDNPPKTISDVEIGNLIWLSDGTLEVWLSYDISTLRPDFLPIEEIPPPK